MLQRKKRSRRPSIKIGIFVVIGLLVAFGAGYFVAALQIKTYIANETSYQPLEEYIERQEEREQVYIDENAKIVPPEPASDAEKKEQLSLFNRAFKEDLTTCEDDTRSKADRVRQYEQHLQINQYANRIVARSCHDSDHMFFLNRANHWERSSVNIILGRKHNPEWLKPCYLDDILPAADKARPENTSIDALNLEECKYIAKHKQNLPFGQATGKYYEEIENGIDS